MSQKCCHISPRKEFSSSMCLEECCELLQLASPFIYQEPRREGKDRCMPRPGFLFTHLPTFSRFLLLFSPVPWKRMVSLSLDFVMKLLPVRIRPISFFIGLKVDRSALVYKSAGDLPARVGGSAFLVTENLLYLSYRLLQSIWQYVSTMFPCGVHSVLVCF